MSHTRAGEDYAAGDDACKPYFAISLFDTASRRQISWKLARTGIGVESVEIPIVKAPDFVHEAPESRLMS